MKPLTFWGNLVLSRFSKPLEDRLVYRLIKKHQFSSFVEVGLGEGTRLERMLQVALTYGNPQALRYTGIDLFDARPSEPLKLIEMHRKTRAIPAKTQLVPGDMASAIQRIANSHLRTDMVLVSGGYSQDEWNQAVRFLPRMLHASSKLLLQSQPGAAFEVLSRLDVERMAAAAPTRESDQKVA